MFCVTPDGVAANQLRNKALGDACADIQGAIKDQYSDMPDEDAVKTAGPVAQHLTDYYDGAHSKTVGIDFIDMQSPAAPTKMSLYKER